VEQTEWHDLELWDQQAKIAEKYLKKGSQIYVEGKIKSDKWTDEQGQNRKKMKIRVLSFTMVGGKPEGMATTPAPNTGMAAMPSSSPVASAPMVSLDEGDDDLPF
jgi:single-strand DNA-binding protein